VELSDWHMWWKTEGHRDLYRLLLLWWDPIGVKDVPEAHDEYSGYSRTIGRMLYEDAAEDDFVAFFGAAERNMGLEPIVERNQLVAAKLVEWYGAATGDR
jgi:hypothetical protein